MWGCIKAYVAHVCCHCCLIYMWLWIFYKYGMATCEHEALRTDNCRWGGRESRDYSQDLFLRTRILYIWYGHMWTWGLTDSLLQMRWQRLLRLFPRPFSTHQNSAHGIWGHAYTVHNQITYIHYKSTYTHIYTYTHLFKCWLWLVCVQMGLDRHI